MIVEFFGLPGGGKTTVEKMVISYYRKKGFDVIDRDQLLRHYIDHRFFKNTFKNALIRKINSFCYRLLLSLKWYVKRIKSGESINYPSVYIDQVGKWFVESSELAKHAEKEFPIDKICNLSEGVAHHFISFAVWSKNLVEKLEVSLPIFEGVRKENHLLFFIDAPEALAMERVALRGRPESWPTSVSSEETIGAYSREMAKLQELLKGKHITLVRISTDCKFSEMESRVNTALDSLLSTNIFKNATKEV